MDDLKIALYSDDSGKNVQQPRPAPVQGRKQPNALANVRPPASVNHFQKSSSPNLLCPSDGQKTMEYHGHTIMVNHGRSCFVKWSPMDDHGLINIMGLAKVDNG